MIYLLFLIWPIASIALFFFINKRWGKKNHIALTIFYSLTMLIPFPLEKLVELAIRNKYAKVTPKVLKMLGDKKIKFHAVYGTFLFFHRNGKFRDNDMDFGVWRKDWSKKIELKLEELGFIKTEEFYLDNKLVENCYKHPKLKVSMDIFLIDKKMPQAYGFDEVNKRYCTKESYLKYSLSTYEINGIKFNGPENPDEYLTWIYGPWQKPDPNYHWFYGSSKRPNIIIENANIKYKKIN